MGLDAQAMKGGRCMETLTDTDAGVKEASDA